MAIRTLRTKGEAGEERRISMGGIVIVHRPPAQRRRGDYSSCKSRTPNRLARANVSR